ncbi:MAG: hypothetical protein DELT_01285 [Desulfovibrio sp.]
MELTTPVLIVLAIAAVLTGVSKTGVPGMGILFAVLVPLVIPAKQSTGFILPFLVFGDLIAVIFWRKSAVWRLIKVLLPSMFTGIFMGYLLMDRVADGVYGKILGSIVLFLVVLDWARRRFELPIPVGNPAVGFFMGFLAGVMTMLANAAGSVTSIYFLSMRVSKEEFVGTAAWLFFFMNMFKVPFSASLGLITVETLKVNAMFCPLVAVGAVLGVAVMRRMSLATFEKVTRFLAFCGGVKLLL